VDLCSLSDGRAVTIRPIRVDDGERLRASYARLSDESRYRRFLSVKPRLTAADAHYLVDVDGCDHFALVATVAEADGDAIVAVARFVRLDEDPRAAEFAIVVGDAYQRRGLGAELVSRLADAAARRGVDRFHATLFSDNVAIQRLVARVAGDTVESRRLGAVSEVEFELPPPRRIESGAPAMIAPCAGS
jgi:RimJ/RimL family protein N-acetyltransferase